MEVAMRRRVTGVLGAWLALSACGVSHSTGGQDADGSSSPPDATVADGADGGSTGEADAESSAGPDASGGPDASADADTGANADASAAVDAGMDALASPDADAESGADEGDGGSADAGAAAVDAGSDAGDASHVAETDAQIEDAGGSADATCTALTGPSYHCYGGPLCSAPSQYCVYGAVPNACDPTPAACLCVETYNCACILLNTASCDAGHSLDCTMTDAGAVFVTESVCSH
jgi:hypothetical protein